MQVGIPISQPRRLRLRELEELTEDPTAGLSATCRSVCGWWRPSYPSSPCGVTTMLSASLAEGLHCSPIPAFLLAARTFRCPHFPPRQEPEAQGSPAGSLLPAAGLPPFISCTSTIHWITAVTAIGPELTSATASWGLVSTSPRPTLRGTAVLTGLMLRARGVSVDRPQVQCLLLSGPQGSAHHLHLPHAGFWGCGVLW